MAQSAKCDCTRLFTCGYCLSNAKPYFFTPGPATQPWQAGWDWPDRQTPPGHLYVKTN